MMLTWGTTKTQHSRSAPSAAMPSTSRTTAEYLAFSPPNGASRGLPLPLVLASSS